MEFVERKRSRKSQSFKLVNDAGKPMTADNRRYVSTLECTYRSLTMSDASFCSNHSCLVACLFVVKAFSSSGAFSLSLCTSSSVKEHSTCLSAAWTWWRSSQSRSLQVVLTCSITSSHLHRTQLLLWVTSSSSSSGTIYYICSSFKLRAVCNICALKDE